MANGLFGGGTGILNDPYLIEDAFDLDAVRNDLTAHYKLIADIDLNVSPFNEGEGWIPIGNINSKFQGTFDGNGFVIKNLYINRPSTNYQGLFGYTDGSTIKNIGVEGVNVTGGSRTGGLVGVNDNSSIIENSYSTGSVNGGSYTGGLVGENRISSVIKNSYSTGSVNGGSYTGGLVGQNDRSSVINSYSTESVTGNNQTGGLVGHNYASSITNSYSTGSVTGSYYTGGLVGENRISSVIKNSYSTGSVTGSGNATGGLVGGNDRSSVINSYWDKETSGRTTSAGGEGKTTVEMQTPSTFVGWESEVLEDGTPVWQFKEDEYPYLWFESRYINKTLILSNGKTKTYISNTWENVTEPLDSTVFLNKGMDLSILNRQVTELPPMQMEDKTSILFTNDEVGKVFSKTIDLNKYIDIRSVNVEVK